MRLVHYLILLFLCAAIGCESSSKTSLTELKPVVLEKDGNQLFQYWEIEDQSYWWKRDLGNISALKAYQDSLSRELGDSVFTAVLQKRSEEQTVMNSDSVPADLSNKELIKRGYAGDIREINYIEAEILNYQINRFPLLSHPTEFHGFIAKNDSLNRIRIYFGASDQPFPPKPNIILSHIEEATSNGWSLKYHVHNHYEPKSNNYVGIMAPSLADAQYYKALEKRFDLGEALITNGFTTVVLDSANFEKFNSH